MIHSLSSSFDSLSAALEFYMDMDWSALSRDKRIPLNTQVTSRTVHSNQSVNVCERLLTDEQKAQLNGFNCQPYPLTAFVKQLQNQSTPSIVQSSQRRFGSCAKDMLDMRHRWFIKSVRIPRRISREEIDFV